MATTTTTTKAKTDTGAGAVAEGRRTSFLRHGVTVPDDCGVREALSAGGLDYRVERVAVATADGDPIEGRFAIRREDTREVFDVVGASYEVVQNEEAFGVLDEYRGVLGARFGCAGTLARGRVAWLQMQLPEGFSVDGDEHELHLIVDTSHDGKRAVRCAITPVRLACLNQMNLALKRATQRWSVRHAGGASVRLAEAYNAAGLVEGYVEEYGRVSRQLLGYKLSERSLAGLLDGLLPDRPSKEREVAAITRLALEAPTNEFGRGTGYAALNAVREYYDHERPQRTTESAFIGASTGVNKRMSDRALEALLNRAAKRAS